MGRVAQAGRVVAGGMGGDTFGGLRLIQTEHRVGGAPDFESAGLLKVLAFEEELGPCQLVEVPRGAHGREVDMRPYAVMGL